MKNNIFIMSILMVLIFNGIYGQTHQLNHQKYWYYRYRLINHFTKIGTEPGESLIFSTRGDDAPFYNGDHSNMLMGDQTITMGQYMAVLALEYNMLAQNNQNTDQTIKELWHLLYAFNRLDLNAESMFRSYINGGTYAAPNPVSGDLNGFFARDDCPRNFLQMNENHFKSDVVYSKANQYIDSVNSDWMIADAHYTDPAYLLERKRAGLKPSELITFNASQSEQNDAVNGALTSIEMSFDQVYRIVFGLATIKKMLPDNLTYNGGESFQDGETGIKEEAMNILDRVMGQSRGLNDPIAYAVSHTFLWTLYNPITNKTVAKGPLSGYCWALAESGNSMRYGFYDVPPNYYLFPLVQLPYGGPLYHTPSSIILGYRSWRVSASSFSIGNENDNRHMYSILAAMIGVRNDWPGFKWAYTGGIDHEPFQADHTPLVRRILHGGNGNYYSDSYYINLLNSAPCIGPYKWEYPNDAAPYDWSTQDRLGHPERRGYGYDPSPNDTSEHKVYAPSRAGEYAGVDYMLYHNLYYTIHHSDYLNPTNLMDNRVTYPFPLQVNFSSFIGTNAYPVEIDMFNTLRASNIIRGDETNYLSNNESGKVTYRAGQTIYLQPGFEAEVGSDFYAYVKKFECAADGSYHANSTIVGDNVKGDTMYGMNITDVNFHEEEQNTEYSYYFYDERDPGKSGYGIVTEYDVPEPADTSNIGSYLSNFVDVTPNPTKGVSVISLPEQFFGQGNFTVSIHSLMGALLFEKEYQETNQLELDFSSYPKGMYIVNILLGESQIKLTKKVVRE